MTVGERIKEVREKTGMSQVDFADKINVSKQTLYKYENNLITNIPSDKIEAVAKVGGVSPAYLMGWEEIDSRFSGREASDEIYRKFADNIERHHGKEKELLEVYNQLSDENKDKTLQYSKGLLSVQQMDSELLLNAAHHSRSDFTDEERQEDEDMLD